jgi:uncharacterized membrane protein
VRLSSIAERFRASLFIVPLIAVVTAIAVAAASLVIDRRIDSGSTQLPLGLTSTVDNARALLSTVAGATITFAAIAFSISVLIIQQASSQYSPRVVHTLFRDPFNKRVMGLVLGTFTYCLIVLRSVRTALEKSGAPIIPNVSVSIAVVLGVITILAIVAFINHSAHSMDISEILARVQREAIVLIRREWSLSPTDTVPSEPIRATPQPAYTINFDRSGWIQQIDPVALLRCVPEGGTMFVEAYPGRYAIEGTPLCKLSSVTDDIDMIERRVRAAVATGSTRTMQQDVSFGLRQLADVALKALSPGINDPTTAQDAIFHTTAVLAEALRRDPPPRVRSDDTGHRLVLAQQPTHDDLVGLAFDETRRAAASQPSVCVYLLEALELLKYTLETAGLTARLPAIDDQARLVVAGCDGTDNLPADRQMVRDAFAKRFTEPT